MRNLFDQYSQPENRLTHALLASLAEDRWLLDAFVRWAFGMHVKKERLSVLEQSFPGEPLDLSEEEAQRRGLPDGCITDGNNWALLIECKVALWPTLDQLHRHMRTARRRGIEDVHLLLLTVHPAPPRLPDNMVAKQWWEVYAWLSKHSPRSAWAKRCLEYMQVAEAKEAAAEYLQEGRLTVFSGIPFGKHEPYTYGQAKRLLKLLREELCKDSRLSIRIAADLSAPGRSAITGQNDSGVWDYIPIRQAHRAQKHTEYPHLTLVISRDRVGAFVTVPNGMTSTQRAQVFGADMDGFESVIQGATIQMVQSLRKVRGFVPEIIVLQRHWPSRRAPSVVDCLLRLDVRTALPTTSRYRGPVKSQPQWLKAAYEALTHRQSNLEFQIGCSFPYEKCPTVSDPALVQAIADVWLACASIIKRSMGHRVRPRRRKG
ncbi:MAG: hypothetical protein WBK08_08195 [Nitrospira sp.]|nr:MAG: hypothetical protein E8D42_09280 [Nitrospira sp.]